MVIGEKHRGLRSGRLRYVFDIPARFEVVVRLAIRYTSLHPSDSAIATAPSKLVLCAEIACRPCIALGMADATLKAEPSTSKARVWCRHAVLSIDQTLVDVVTCIFPALIAIEVFRVLILSFEALEIFTPCPVVDRRGQ